MKKFNLIILATLFVLLSSFAYSVEINYFYQRGCPACAQQDIFLQEIQDTYENITINKYDITRQESRDILNQLIETHQINVERFGVPITFVEEHFFLGYHESHNKQIINLLEKGFINDEETSIKTVNVPLFGEIDLSESSLLFAAIVIGSLDGLNVCSIGALILILAIVIKFNSRKKTLLFGGIFITTTAFVYGLLVFAWYSLIRSFLGYIPFLEMLIGIIAILGGIYFFKKFILFYKYGPACQVQTNKHVLKLQKKVEKIISNPKNNIGLAISAVVLFAIIITLVELPCSFFFPLVYSGLLADAGVGFTLSAIYVLIYLFFYMLIEIVIFLTAVYTKKLWYGPDRAVTWVTLLASIVMILLGLYYLI